MARKFPSEFVPIRIGATLSKGAVLCEGACGPKHRGQEQHVQPNYKFTLLLFMAVIKSIPPGMAEANQQFVGGPHTPPVEVTYIRLGPDRPLASLIGWN